MAVTQVGAIYATASKLLQRVYIPSHDDSENNSQQVGAGETLLLVPIATYQQGISAIQALIGTPTFSGRCAVVDGTNKAVAIIMADPAVYSSAGNTVVADDHAQLTDTWTGTQFTRQWAEASPTTGIVAVISTKPIFPTPAPATTGNVMVPMLGPNANLQVNSVVVGITHTV